MQELRNRTPYAIAVAPFVHKDGRSVAAVIVKGTFDLKEGRQSPVLAEEQVPVGLADDHFEDDETPSSLRYASEAVPAKRGTDVALETADIALMGDDLSKLPLAVGLSRQSRRIIRQNLVISLGVVVILIVGALTGLADIGPAIVLHEGSTLLECHLISDPLVVPQVEQGSGYVGKILSLFRTSEERLSGADGFDDFVCSVGEVALGSTDDFTARSRRIYNAERRCGSEFL